jgi:hypothetical protein
MDMTSAIRQVEIDINRYKNIKREKILELKNAYRTLIGYCEPCDCNKGDNFDLVFEKSEIICGKCDNLRYIHKHGANVVPALRIIKEQIDFVNNKYDKEISELEEGLKVIREMNTVCETCTGSGYVYKPRPNVYCERERVVCPDCKGTGIILNKRG